MKFLLLSSIAVFVGYLLLSGPVQEPLPGNDDFILLQEIPAYLLTEFVQKKSAGFRATLKEYSITALADVTITGRILSKENYNFGRETDLSPTDLALGWGPMSDPDVLAQLNITQSGRWYRWQTLQASYPIDRIEIERNSANMHLIPANEKVAEVLKQLTENQIINLTGHLVKVTAADGWHWQSSLTRNDTGEGACELIWVTHLKPLSRD